MIQIILYVIGYIILGLATNYMMSKISDENIYDSSNLGFMLFLIFMAFAPIVFIFASVGVFFKLLRMYYDWL